MKKEYVSPSNKICELGTQPILTSGSNKEKDIPAGGSTNHFDVKEQAFEPRNGYTPWASEW